MSLYRKLVLFLLAAVVLPIVALALVLVRASEDALSARIRASQAEAVEAEAAVVASFVTDRVDGLRRAAAYFDLASATPDELEGAVRVLYKASADVSAAALLDAKGAPLAPAAFLSAPSSEADLAAHPLADPASVERMLAYAPAARALREGAGAVVLSPAYAVPERGETALAVALPVARAGGGPAVFAVELSLGALQRRMARTGATGTLEIVDREGRAVAHPDVSRLREVQDAPEVRAAIAASAPATARETGPDGPVLAAFAPVPVEGLGWRVVASLPEGEAFAPVRRMRGTILGAVAAAVVLLLAAGALFVGRVRRGLERVMAGARAFSRGELGHRIAPPGEAELAALATTFNAMGEELSAARARLETWNEALQAEVEARTAELKEAQARLLQTQKLAAVGQLGAGVAHEINNPLAGILGNVQLLMLRKRRAGATASDPELDALEQVEQAAVRCSNVTQGLLRFSQQGTSTRRDEVDLNALAREAEGMTRGPTEAQGARLELDLEEPAPVVRGDGGHLTQALLHLLSNARTALAGREGGTIRVATRVVGGEAELVVEDDGKGIDPAIRDRIFEPFFTTKDVWTNLGLGLAVTYRIVDEHEGRIEVESTPGQGTRVALHLPLAAGSARQRIA